MELKRMKNEELERLYETDLTVDFPPSELKPLRSMLRLADRGIYEPLLAQEDGESVGYALVWLSPDRTGGLVDYLGVLRGKRNGGLGGKLLDLLAARYGQIFGEAEAPDTGDAEVDDLRRRRIGFYERNGLRVLDYECALFGVHFNCLYRGPEQDDRKVEKLHRSVYEAYFSPEHMAQCIQLPLHPGETVKPAPEWVGEDVFSG